MSKTLTIGNEEYIIPEEGDNAGYGEEVTDFLEAVSEALGTVQQPNDIPVSSGTILNNVSVATAIPGFSFDTSEVISITCEYRISRTTDVPAVNLVESGFIEGNFDGSSWSISRRHVGNSGVDLDITPAGAITYTSSNLTGSNYTSSISFKAKVFNQPE